jgi:ribonuclease BN (tRNA processing enzyme)
VVIDAGCIGFYQSAQDQARVRHLFITHTHIDHVASLPIFVENAYEGKPDPVTIHATDPVLYSIQTDLFNNRLWPDFIALSDPKAPFLKLERLDPGRSVEVEGLRLTPVEVNHVVPTVGYIVEDATSVVVFPSDTAPTDEIWRRANAFPNLKAVFLEATFPNNLAWLADVAKHLTPALFAAEVAKLHRPATIVAVHLKARFHQQVANELLALGLPNLVLAKSGSTYNF